jgi:hypothetical protein
MKLSVAARAQPFMAMMMEAHLRPFPLGYSPAVP